MPVVKYLIKNSINQTVISPLELLERYFFGTPIVTKDGKEMSSSEIKNYILQAQNTIEDFLSIKLFKQEIDESFPFVRRDFEEWGIIKTSYPVVQPKRLNGYLNDMKQINYPKEWISARRSNDEKTYQRRINIVPANNSPTTNSIAFNGIVPNLGYFGIRGIPDYWRVAYCTGFDIIPLNLINAISIIASIPLFAILGDVTYGAGISSKSLSLDGLSQAISIGNSGDKSAYSARIKSLNEELSREMKILDSVYGQINFAVA